MAKRKRNNDGTAPVATPVPSIKATPSKKAKHSETVTKNDGPIHIQIVTGSYDRILHGITATFSTTASTTEFADTFLFDAHTSAIRCLAISPPSAPVPKQTQKVILASGSTDQRINLYHLSAHAPRKVSKPSLLNNGRRVVENAQNKELGALLHHASTVTALSFPTRSKLLSSAEDSTIAVTRTRDWSLLSTIKAPIPKVVGRPSGDTAPLGGAPAGVNDFAVHPSMKIMISVGKGEKVMRLWNLVTGKKAGILEFRRKDLSEIGEGRFGSGEGRKLAWGNTQDGEEFCVAFDRGILVYGMNSEPKCKVISPGRTKMHKVEYVSVGDNEDRSVLAVSTEDGRILFYSTATADITNDDGKEDTLPCAKLIAQLGGKESGILGRIKDFKLLRASDRTFVITANSEGKIGLWTLEMSELRVHEAKEAKQVGKLSGTYETGNRVTCLEGFVMLPTPEADELEEDINSPMAEGKDEDSDSDSE